MTMKKAIATLLTLAAMSGAHAAPKADIVRHKIPNSDFPIALAVTIPPTATIHFISGQVPAVVNKDAPGDSLEAFGDTKTQTISVLGKIKKTLEDQGYKLDDVVMMRVLLVGDPAKGGAMDFAGMMESYNAVYQPLKSKPARITSQVASLVRPGMFAEIEVQAAKAPAK